MLLLHHQSWEGDCPWHQGKILLCRSWPAEVDACRRGRPPTRPHLWRPPTSFPTARWSPAATRGSSALWLFLSIPRGSPQPLMRNFMTPSGGVMFDISSGRTSTPTSSCPVVLLCSPASLTVWRRRWPNLSRNNTKINIIAPPERKYSTWIGGWIPPSLPVHVDLQGGVRPARRLHRPQEVLLDWNYFCSAAATE